VIWRWNLTGCGLQTAGQFPGAFVYSGPDGWVLVSSEVSVVIEGGEVVMLASSKDCVGLGVGIAKVVEVSQSLH
jgi:hypothetical protein